MPRLIARFRHTASLQSVFYWMAVLWVQRQWVQETAIYNFQQDADDNSQAALQAARSETLSGTMPATPLPVRRLTHLKRRKLKRSGGTACVYVLEISGRGQSPVYKCDGLDGITAKGQGRQSMKPGQNGTSTDRADVMGSLLDTSRRPAGIGPRSLTDMSGAWW
jgi:hypothetical protein